MRSSGLKQFGAPGRIDSLLRSSPLRGALRASQFAVFDGQIGRTLPDLFRSRFEELFLLTDITLSDVSNTAFGAPGRIRTCYPRLSLPLQFSLLTPSWVICGLDHLFTISGAARMASTEPINVATARKSGHLQRHD